jgi:hypothetical protein
MDHALGNRGAAMIVDAHGTRPPIDVDGGKAYIRRINETAHLDAIAHQHDTE